MAFVPKFSYSIKAQSLAPKKLYVLDQGLISSASASYSKNHGRILENFVFNQIRRATQDVCYVADGSWECDFVVYPHDDSRTQFIQVCWELQVGNEEREIEGLVNAMELFGKTHGTIITFDQSDQINVQNKVISVIPASLFSLPPGI
jgi:predicted AAA+ superfamily ATPase